MLKRAASHLKGMSTGFVNNAINAAGGFTSGFTSAISGNQSKVAAELLKKSPLEIDKSPKEKLGADPLQFSFIQYPIDLQNIDLGHYIVFYALSNNYDSPSTDLMVSAKMGAQISVGTAAGDFDTGTATRLTNIRKSQSNQSIPSVKAENSVLSKFPSHTQTTAAIALYMPPGVGVTYKMSYATEATELSGTIANALGKAKSATGTSGQIKEVLRGTAAGMGAIGKKLLDGFGDAFSLGKPSQLMSKAFGVAMNPHEEQFFEKPEFRSFDYTFDFWPKNEKEMDAVNKIIFLFKYHMHPTLDQAAGGVMFKVPSEFDIEYYNLGRQNTYLNKISRCVLKDMSVKYGTEEQFSTFIPDTKGAAPVTTSLTLTFQENQFITKQDIYEGY
tara:strand:- start:272 stop:1432 length:1161 start_codon:yes stop_codon:yes gene_type:complete